jgi:hypothetical protein
LPCSQENNHGPINPLKREGHVKNGGVHAWGRRLFFCAEDEIDRNISSVNGGIIPL